MVFGAHRLDSIAKYLMEAAFNLYGPWGLGFEGGDVIGGSLLRLLGRQG